MKLRSVFFVLFLAISQLAVSNTPTTIERINAFVDEKVGPFTDSIASFVFSDFEFYGNQVPFVLLWLVFAAVFFTVRFKFINIRGVKYAVNLIRGKYDLPGETIDWDGDELAKPPKSPRADGQVSHFQALTTALSGTVGLGNISGVAIAIATGGPGATFWMIVAGFFGMTSKFVECTLGVKYRNVNADGSVSGGPMYYLSKGLKELKLPMLGKVLAVFFAIMCVGGSLGGGNMYQANQARAQFVNLPVFEGTFMRADGGAFLFGLVLAVAVAIVIIGGIKSIAKVTDKIVPLMCGVYLIAAIGVLGFHYIEIPTAFSKIFDGAFSAKAGFGGFLGVLIQGFRRAAFSNEAGIGSAAIAHSAVQTDKPVTEGLVALLEPFIDTVVICTMTALVIIITGAYQGDAQGVEMTAGAFETVFGTSAVVILTIAVVLFAFSTMISWSYYGLKAWTYLFGEGSTSEVSYKVLFCCFVIIGAMLSLNKVVEFSDAMIFAMAFPNIIGLYLLSSKVNLDLKAFMKEVSPLKNK